MLYTTNGKRCCVVRYNCAFNFPKNKNSLEPNGIESGRRRERTKTNGRERAREQTNKFVRSIVLVLHFQSDTVDFAFGIKNFFFCLLFVSVFHIFARARPIHCIYLLGQIAQILYISPPCLVSFNSNAAEIF